MFKGAGVLPYAFNNNKIYFLLGKEHDEKLFSDFGGGRDKDEQPFETAYREFVEETMNSLKETAKIKNRLQNQKTYFINDDYHTFLIEISKDDNVIDTYNRIYSELSKCQCPIGLCEKSELKWFTPSEILRNEKLMRSKFFDSYLFILFSLLS